LENGEATRKAMMPVHVTRKEAAMMVLKDRPLQMMTQDTLDGNDNSGLCTGRTESEMMERGVPSKNRKSCSLSRKRTQKAGHERPGLKKKLGSHGKRETTERKQRIAAMSPIASIVWCPGSQGAIRH
jgi:hypothetical protein